MSDDWSGTTAEYTLMEFELGTDELVDRPPRDEDASIVIDPVMGVTERDLRGVECFFHQRALDASTDVSPTTLDEDAQLEAFDLCFAQLRSRPGSARSRQQRRR